MLSAFISVLGLGLFGVVGWAVQLGNRVSSIETRHDDIMLLLDSKFDEVNRRLGRIETALNGSLRKVK